MDGGREWYEESCAQKVRGLGWMVKGIPEDYFLVVEGLIRFIPSEGRMVCCDFSDECIVFKVDKKKVKVDDSCRKILLITDENIFCFIEGSKLLANGKKYLMVHE
jgi:hypothetical protein